MKVSGCRLFFWGGLFWIGLALCCNADRERRSPSKKSLNRIVSLAPNITEILFQLGLEKKIVGVTRFCRFPEKATQKRKIGGLVDINISAIVDLKPDLVIGTSAMSRFSQARFKKNHLPLTLLPFYTLPEIFDSIQVIGRLTRRNRQGQRLVESMRLKLAAIQKKVNLNRQRIVYICGHKPLIIAGKGTFIDGSLKLLNGVNIAGESLTAYPVFSLESIVLGQPDIIIDAFREKQADPLKFWRKWQSIPAVRNRRVYSVDPNLLTIPGPRIIGDLEQVVQLLRY